MWARHYIDEEPVSREEFFERTTPSIRMTLEKFYSSGGPSIYASADEWADDMEAIMLENSVLSAAEVRQMVAEDARSWTEDVPALNVAFLS